MTGTEAVTQNLGLSGETHMRGAKAWLRTYTSVYVAFLDVSCVGAGVSIM